MSLEKWGNLSKEDYNRLFKNTSVERTEFKRLKRNIEFITKDKI